MNLFLTMVVFLAAFVVICLGALWILQRLIQGRVEDKLRAAEVIANGHRVPKAWIKQDQIRPGASPRSEARAKERCLKKLDELIVYFRSCPFVDSEESREVLLEELGAVREAWRDCTWTGILAWGSDSIS